jgi:hypothetical protein
MLGGKTSTPNYYLQIRDLQASGRLAQIKSTLGNRKIHRKRCIDENSDLMGHQPDTPYGQDLYN